MIGHAHPVDRNSEVVIDDAKGRLARIETATPLKTTKRILEVARQRGWAVTWASGFQEARDTVGYNAYTLERGQETRRITTYFPIAGDLYLGAM